MERLKFWWSLRWFRNVVFLIVLIVMYFTGALDWTMVRFMQLTLRSPKAEVNVQPSETLFRYNYRFVDENGDEHTLSEFEGSPVLLNFWASWCKPCLAEFPSLERMRNKEPDLVTLFITRQSGTEFAVFLERENYNLPFYRQSGGNPPELDHNAIPATYVLNKQGQIVYTHFGSANWDNDDVITMIKKITE